MSGQDPHLVLLEEPVPLPLDRVLAAPATALLVTGIVNPFGPTLDSVMVSGDLQPDARLPVVRVMLNPFQDEVEVIGELSVGAAWNPRATIRSLAGLPFGSCPTLLLPSALLDPEASVEIHAEFLRRFADARNVWEMVRRFPGNPWERVSEELQQAWGQDLWSGLPGETDPLDGDEAREFARLLLSEDHAALELEAFCAAWTGSIGAVGSTGGLPAMGLERFLDVFDHLAASCRLPSRRRSDGGAPSPGGPGPAR